MTVRHGQQRSGWRRLALGLFILAALAWQSFVTQTHIHYPPAALAIEVAAGQGQSAHAARSQSPYDSPADCPLCREMASSGHYITPAPISFVPPALAAIGLAVPILRGHALSQRSHRWQSRAPPPVA